MTISSCGLALTATATTLAHSIPGVPPHAVARVTQTQDAKATLDMLLAMLVLWDNRAMVA
ncbi:hypothetical protein [Nitrospirillum iridis]|uniref:Uncharacterized protein n=1 Tax=Nitrospirillum iridis TaxID=765888 RepID=A0A7X0ATN4_9PROT|nr:hypothetical protein [Nitrospirillum iridis]MBB6249860.1 hypothetical protein [Nitrospirillum iridis]